MPCQKNILIQVYIDYHTQHYFKSSPICIGDFHFYSSIILSQIYTHDTFTHYDFWVLYTTLNDTDICLSVNRSWAQCLLPYAFYFCWLASMGLNIAWLLLWDREYVFFLYFLQNKHWQLKKPQHHAKHNLSVSWIWLGDTMG